MNFVRLVQAGPDHFYDQVTENTYIGSAGPIFTIKEKSENTTNLTNQSAIIMESTFMLHYRWLYKVSSS